MNTKPKRKYGEVKKGAETTLGTNQSVFDKFLPSTDTTVPSTPPSPRPSTPARQPSPRDVAPNRDFQKVANSITRDAIPSGMFNGKAKQLYDCLYSLTRGAIVPSMTVRISRAALMKKSGIGAKVTLEQNLRRLALSGLVSIKTIGGVQGGNEYTVRLPEEAIPSTPPSTGTSLPSPPSSGENVGVLAPLESSPPSHGLSADYQTTSDDPKTLIKDRERIDDEAAPLRTKAFEKFEVFTNAIESLDVVVKELTGKGISKSDASKWSELFELLATELKIAAARTTVSSVPAFLTEHLRRRLFKRSADEMRVESREAVNSPAAQPVDASKCLDCGNTGWWYPEGPEKGVARCAHARLGAE